MTFINPFAIHGSTAIGSRKQDVDICGGGGVILGADAAYHTLASSRSPRTLDSQILERFHPGRKVFRILDKLPVFSVPSGLLRERVSEQDPARRL